jgi:hypothetical protein
MKQKKIAYAMTFVAYIGIVQFGTRSRQRLAILPENFRAFSQSIAKFSEINVKVKQSHYGSGQALGVSGV